MRSGIGKLPRYLSIGIVTEVHVDSDAHGSELFNTGVLQAGNSDILPQVFSGYYCSSPMWITALWHDSCILTSIKSTAYENDYYSKPRPDPAVLFFIKPDPAFLKARSIKDVGPFFFGSHE